MTISSPSDDPADPPSLLVDEEDAVRAAQSFLGSYAADDLEGVRPSDFLCLRVEPENQDSPELETERHERAGEWASFQEDEAAINIDTGEWSRWSPEEVERKGGLDSDWRWVRDLSSWEVFRLLVIPREYR